MVVPTCTCVEFRRLCLRMLAAGECAETTAMNPQFHVAIPRTSNNKCHVVVSVTQHYETLPEAKVNKQLFAIGFAVYEVPHSMPRLTKQFVAENVIRITNYHLPLTRYLDC